MRGKPRSVQVEMKMGQALPSRMYFSFVFLLSLLLRWKPGEKEKRGHLNITAQAGSR